MKRRSTEMSTDRESRDKAEAVTGQDATFASVLAGLVSSMGVAGLEVQDSAQAAVVAVLASRQLSASVVSLRYGTATLEAPAVEARLLGYLHDELLGEISAATGGSITSLRIRVAPTLAQ